MWELEIGADAARTVRLSVPEMRRGARPAWGREVLAGRPAKDTGPTRPPVDRQGPFIVLLFQDGPFVSGPSLWHARNT